MLITVLQIILTIIIFILGASFASYLTCVGERLGKEEKIIRKSSECPHCHHELKTKDIIPILSWITLKGKCRYCKAPIPVNHLWTEIALGALFACSYLRFGFSISFARSIILLICFFAASVEDVTSRTVHDILLMIPVVVWMVTSFFDNTGSVQEHALHMAICACITISIILIVCLVEMVAKRELLGGADIKAIGVGFLFLGLSPSILMLELLIGVLLISYVFYNSEDMEEKAQPLIPCIGMAVNFVYMFLRIGM